MQARPWGNRKLGDRQADGTADYTFARPGPYTVEGLVIGGTRSGMYEIGEDIDLGKLIALAGGGNGGTTHEDDSVPLPHR